MAMNKKSCQVSWQITVFQFSYNLLRSEVTGEVEVDFNRYRLQQVVNRL